MEYILGIDGGGTKSHLALFDITGKLIDFGHWGSLNHEGMKGSFDQFYDEVNKFVSQILLKNNVKIDQVVSAAFGIAGVDTKWQHDVISQMIEKVGFKKFTLANDAYLGIPAGSPTGVGICAINGTGCTVVGVNSQGKMLQIGGVGYVSADYGGGGMLGRVVISTVYEEILRKGEKTLLTPALFEYLELDLKNKYDFVERIYDKFGDHTLSIHACGRLLFDAALKNDKVALDILYKVGVNYANGINAMIEELEFDKSKEDINIVLAGSVFVKGDHSMSIDTLKEKLNKEKPDCNLIYTVLKVPPVAGAAFWAFNNLNITDKKTYYEKVCSQLQN
ncbi:MAG: hypothetical protein FWD24_00460 [Treponema sp.]|nr:hypothetical protein [Treponema sp.]